MENAPPELLMRRSFDGKGGPDGGLCDVPARYQWRIVGPDTVLVDVEVDRREFRLEPYGQQHRVERHHRDA